MSERDDAIIIANKVLERPFADPDDDLAMLARQFLRALERQQWHPINTAPMDGTKILLAKIVGHIDHPTAIWWVIQGHWSEKWQNWNDGSEPCGLSSPTHWMPVSRLLAPVSP